MSIEARIGLTFEDVWKMFQETDKKFQETAEEIKAMSKEADKKMKKTANTRCRRKLKQS
jgi:tRNA U34 5-carboxymethylaminomethyl modifying enzyme MnmG/GidA